MNRLGAWVSAFAARRGRARRYRATLAETRRLGIRYGNQTRDLTDVIAARDEAESRRGDAQSMVNFMLQDLRRDKSF